MFFKKENINQKGFTLIEVLLVVAIIALLAGIVILAINPNRQLAQSKNSERAADVTTILNAVYQYAIDNDGVIPASITATATDVCATGGDCTGIIDLGVLTASETYLTSIPTDPTGSDADSAGYQISSTANNRVTVDAPDAENGETISVTR